MRDGSGREEKLKAEAVEMNNRVHEISGDEVRRALKELKKAGLVTWMT